MNVQGLKVLFVSGLVLLGVGSFLGWRVWRFSRTARAVRGVVVDFSVKSVHGGGDVHCPVVEYSVAGKKHRWISSSGSKSPRLPVGREVALLYDPAKPTNAMRKSALHRYSFPVFVVLAGVGFLAAPIVAWM